MYRITVLPQQQNIESPAGANLLQVLRDADLAPDAPCGGTGRCGKCKVLLDGQEPSTMYGRKTTRSNAASSAAAKPWASAAPA